MRHNKYFALFMALLAVAVVLYQFVLRPSPTASSLRRPAAPPARAVAARPALPAPAAAGAEAPAPAERALIDMDSGLLLRRVYEAPDFTAADAELPAEFGQPIFSRGAAPAAPGRSPASDDSAQLLLQGTVLDGRRCLAIISHQIVAVGDFVGGAQVLAIRPREVDMLQGGRTFRLVTDPSGLKIEWLGEAREK